MINESELRQIIEQADPDKKISVDTVEEIISALKGLKRDPPMEGVKYGELIDDLKRQIVEEVDWRKRVKIAAKIISIGLE